MYRFHPFKGWQTQPHTAAHPICLEGLPACRLPREFAAFTGPLPALEICDARHSPSALAAVLKAGRGLVLTGPYAYIDGVYRYCQRQRETLVAPADLAHYGDALERRTALVQTRRQRLHHLLVAMRGESLLRVDRAPATLGMQDWLQEPTGEAAFLIPVRRLQRILTDIQRAHQGVPIQALGSRLTILPHVYVPGDQSVPAMFTAHRERLAGRRVLDMGTGTGVLALLAIRLGAARVTAVDFNANAVLNVRLNARRAGLQDRIEVPPPGDLFKPVIGRRFDTIVFNAPWIQGSPQTLYDTALYDPNYQVLDSFLGEAPHHLETHGTILLQYGHIDLHQGEDSRAHLRRVLAANNLVINSATCKGHQSRVGGRRAQIYLYEIGRQDTCY